MLRHRWDGRLEKHDLILAFREAITCVNTQATRYHHFWEERLARMLSITGSTRLGTMRQQLVDAQGDLGDVEKAVKLFTLARKRCAALMEELISHIGEFTDEFSLMMRAVVEEVTGVDWSCMEPPGREHAALTYQLADGFSNIHKQEEAELLLRGGVGEGESIWRKLEATRKATEAEGETDGSYDPHERLLAGGRVAPKTQRLRKSASAAAADATGASVLPREAFAAVVIFTHYLPTFFHEELLDMSVDVRPAVVDQHKFAMTELDVWSCEPLNARRLQLQQHKHKDAATLLPLTLSITTNANNKDEQQPSPTASAAPKRASSPAVKANTLNTATKKASLALGTPPTGSKRNSNRPIESAGSSRKAVSIKGGGGTTNDTKSVTTDTAHEDDPQQSGVVADIIASPHRSRPGPAEPLVITCCCYDNTSIHLSTLYVGTESGAVLAIPVRAASVAEARVTGADLASSSALQIADHDKVQEKVRAAISTLIKDWKWALEGKVAAKRQRRKAAAEGKVLLAGGASVNNTLDMGESTMDRSGAAAAHSSSLPPKGGSASSATAAAAKTPAGGKQKPGSREGVAAGKSVRGVGRSTVNGSINSPADEPTAPVPEVPKVDAVFDAKLPPRTLDGVTLFDGHLFPVTSLHFIPSTQILVSCSVGDKSVRFHCTKNGGRLLNIESTAFSGAPSCSVYYGALEAVVVGTYSGHLRMVDPKAGGPPVGTMQLPNHPIHSITVDPYTSELFVGTRKGHIYGFRLNVDAHHYRPRLEPLNDTSTFSQECLHCFVPDVKEALGYKLHEPLVIPGMRSAFTTSSNRTGAHSATATSYSNTERSMGDDEEGEDVSYDEDADLLYDNDDHEPWEEMGVGGGGSCIAAGGLGGITKGPKYVRPPTIYDDNTALLRGRAGVQERKHPGFHQDLKNRNALDPRKKNKRLTQSTTPRSIREAATSGRHLLVTGGHTVAVTCMVAISGFLFSGDAVGRILQWDLLTHELVRKFHGHSDDITSMTVTADGFLFSTSKDALITVWNAIDGNALMTINRHYGGVSAIALGYLGGEHVPNIFSGEQKSQGDNMDDSRKSSISGGIGVGPSSSADGGGAPPMASDSGTGGPTGPLRHVLESTRQRATGSASDGRGGVSESIFLGSSINKGISAQASPVRQADLDVSIPYERPLNAIESLTQAQREAAAAAGASRTPTTTGPAIPTTSSTTGLVCSRENIKIGCPSPPVLLSISADQTVVSWKLKYRD
jgi:WD40 repeat protein